MKRIGKPADSVSKAKDPEEANSIIRDAGMELSDEEMAQVSGGMGIPTPHINGLIGDNVCKCENSHVYSLAEARQYGFICPQCKERLLLTVIAK